MVLVLGIMVAVNYPKCKLARDGLSTAKTIGLCALKGANAPSAPNTWKSKIS